MADNNSTTTSLSEEFKKYTDRMLEIHKLSSPDILSFDSAETYSERLRNNFRKIGVLAAQNRKMLDEVLYPYLESEEILEDDIVGELEEYAEALINLGGEDGVFENLDLPVASQITEKLLKDAEEKDEMSVLIKRMDEQIDICYSLMNMTERLDGTGNIARESKDKGIELGNKFLKMLDKDFFLTINDEECRETVLTDSRFMTAFYERNMDHESNCRTLEILDLMLSISEDDFYIKAVPDYDWKYFRFRTLDYFLNATDIHNSRGFNKDQLTHIADMVEVMESLCQSDPSYFSEIPGYDFLPIHELRCRYLDGRIDIDSYKEQLVNLYYNRNKDDYGDTGSLINSLLPLEILCIIDPQDYSASDALILKDIYQGLTAYLFHSPSHGILSFMMEYVIDIINRFIEVPGGVTFEEFVLECMSALHPPTFIHSRMVALISSRLSYHLISNNPKVFVGMPGFDNEADVINKTEEIINFVYHSGLCHDFGKIGIIDTIFVYGRRLLNFEFDIIKSHPIKGAQLLSRHYSTHKYADIAQGHHCWYDDSKGYPYNFKTSESPYKAVIDIVQCADCMDAATDSVGRSYNRGKTLSEFMEELKNDSGTRYAPWLYELLKNDKVYYDLEFLLDKGRDRNYKETYNLLRGVQDKG